MVPPATVQPPGGGLAVGPPKVGVTPLAALQQQQQAAKYRIGQYEAAIEADSYDVAAWDGWLREVVKEGKPRPIFERAVKQFPTAARIWTSYAEWAEAQEGSQAALAVYERCLQQIPSLDLWSSYLTFCKRHEPLENTINAYTRAIELLGTDWRAGLLWSEYMAILKHAYNAQIKRDYPDAEVTGKLLAEDPNPVETARKAMKPAARALVEQSQALDIGEQEFLRCGEVLKIDITMLRNAFQRAAAAAHSALDKLWIGYEQFEKSLGNPQLAQKLLGEHMPRYHRGKAAFKELQTICTGVDHFAVAVPLRAKNAAQQSKHIEKWRSILQYERSNPLKLGKEEVQARVTLTFQQAALSCAFHAEIWHDFAAWLDAGGQKDQATIVLRRAVERWLPRDLTLRLLLVHRYEIIEVPPSESSLQTADDEYRKLCEEMPKPCPLALINHLAFMRRQRSPHDFRDGFIEATESSPHCTWEVYVFAALTEYHVYGSTEAAARVFRLGLERYGEREPSLLAAYINFLIGANDLKSARAELSRGVLDRMQAGVRDKLANRSDPLLKDSLAFLWQKWARLERYFGEADAIQRAASFRNEEFRNFQRDHEVEEESILDTPVSLGLSATIAEVEEGFRFQHLVPQTSRVDRLAEAAQASGGPLLELPAPPAQPAPEGPAPVASPTLVDQSLTDATKEHKQLSSNAPANEMSVHISRPDVSKMLAFRPALDVVGQKGKGTVYDPDERTSLPTMIPKCIQDLLAVLPARPLKGAKPDVDYLLTVLQTVEVPPVDIKDLEHFRYDSLRLLKEERLGKDEGGGDGFFSSRPTLYRDRLQAKRQKVMDERVKPEQA